MIVCKFGGTSVGTADAIRRLAEIVATRANEQPIVVVSALSGVTNRLLEVADAALGNRPTDAAATLDTILGRHRETARELGLGPEALAAIEGEFAVAASWIDAPGRFPSPDALRDAIAALGELASARLVAAALAAAGLPSRWVDVRPVIVTNDRYLRAAPDQAEIACRAAPVFRPLLNGGIIPVTQGFLGATRSGATTTLGRGGSDYTASLLGAALEAVRVEIWTDVDGIMTADPRIVPSARVLPTASHWEAAELATFGAKVLHPATQAPLIEKKIPCIVLNSFAPERPGTQILVGVVPDPVSHSPVRSISWKRGVTVINIRAPRMLGAIGFLRTLFDLCAKHDASVDVISTSEINVSMTLDAVADLPGLVYDLEQLGEVTIFENRAIVAVVGVGLRGTRGLAARLFKALAPINVEMISQGASEINVTLVVLESDGPTAVRLLHQEFFDSEAA
jgi:aspartate kinase